MNWLERAIVPWRDITKVADTRVVSCTQSGGFQLPPVWGFGATWVVEAGLARAPGGNRGADVVEEGEGAAGSGRSGTSLYLAGRAWAWRTSDW